MPSRIVLTSNYDFAIEASVTESGREPVTFWHDRAAAWSPPAPDEVHVVHLHGVASDPSTLVLPGPTTQALEADQRFLTVLNAIVGNRLVLYLGFALGESETHLRQDLEWLARSFGDAGGHHLLLPATAAARRGGDLDDLAAIELVTVHEYDDADGHDAVLEAALLLAPDSPARVESLVGRAPRPVEHWRMVPMVASERDDDRGRLASRAVAAELGLNAERYAELSELSDAGRAVLQGAPGMGKSQALLALGHRHDPAAGGSVPVYLPLKRVQAPLADDERSCLRSFVEAVANGFGFSDSAPRPTVETLRSGSYLFLLDGFDEVPAERRDGVLRAVLAGVRAYSQHEWVIATRANVDLAALADDGFDRYVLVESRAWGRAYLRSRSIPDATLDELEERLPNVADVVAVPIYAAAIAGPLARGDAVPGSPLAVLLLAEQEAVAVDAEGWGVAVDVVYEYLRRLAVLMQIRGVTETAAADLVAVTGREDLAAAELRVRLVERALLADQPGLLAFPSRLMQEALCADAILAARDPASVIRELAMEPLAGAFEARSDMEHVLDLIWESAPAPLRGELRALDELRWARTQDPSERDAREQALDVLWAWFERRRLWLSDDHGSRQLRGAQRAVERLLRAAPDAAEARRAALVAATRGPLATTRGNAVAWLTCLPEESPAHAMRWLPERLDDANAVVRRLTAVHLEEHRIDEAVPVLHARLAVERDEAAAETLGHALLELVADAQLAALALELWRSAFLWRRLDHEVIARLPRRAAFALLDEPAPSPDAARELLSRLVTTDDEPWGGDDVEALCRIATLHALELEDTATFAKVAELAASDPAAALRGAEAAARHRDQTSALDVPFLRDLPSAALEPRLGGPLEAVIRLLLERRASPPLAPPVPPPRRQTPRATDPDRMALRMAVDEGHYRPERPPEHRERWDVAALTDEQLETLAGLVTAWWPDGRVSAEVRRDGAELVASSPVLSVVLAAAAVDMPLDAERWLDVFGSGAVAFGGRVSRWLARRYAPEVAGAAAPVLAAMEDDFDFVRRLESLPELTDATATVVAERLESMTSAGAAEMVAARLLADGRVEPVARVVSRTGDEVKGLMLREQLAGADDVQAQLASLAGIADDVRAGRPVDRRRLSWHRAARDERLVDPLGELVALLGDAPDNDPDALAKRVRMALAATNSERALLVFDRIVDDPDRPLRAFQWYPRAEMAGDLARRRVRERLPADPASVVALVISPDDL